MIATNNKLICAESMSNYATVIFLMHVWLHV